MIFVSAGNSENFDFAKAVGVGSCSSIGVTRLILEKKPKEIIFLGSCGAYKIGRIFDTFTSQSACNYEHAEILKTGYTPMVRNIGVINETTINSSDYITTDEKMAKALYEKGLYWENMEFFYILQAAQILGIKATGIFCITNLCASNAHEVYMKNFKKANKILAEEAKKYFAQRQEIKVNL